MAEREGFEPFIRFEAKSLGNAGFVECRFLETGNKKQADSTKGRQKQYPWQPCDNLKTLKAGSIQ
jgi:hypothetical protein